MRSIRSRSARRGAPTVPRWRRALGLVLLVLATAPAVAAAQFPGLRRSATAPAAVADTTPRSRVVEHPASPRAAIRAFAAAVRARDLDSAARFLDLAEADTARGRELAARLREVLLHHVVYELDVVSPRAQGDSIDDLDRRVEYLGSVRERDGRETPVRLVRDDTDARWRFGSATVARIDDWYDALPGAWARGVVPAQLLRAGPFDVLHWQWLALLALPLASYVVAWVLARPLGIVVRRYTARSAAAWDDGLADELQAPVRLLLAGLVSTPAVRLIGLPLGPEGFWLAFLRGVVVLAVLWMLLRGTRVLERALGGSPWGTTPQGRSLIPLIGRIVRAVFGLLALLVALSLFGYPVSTLLAGLGIGGIALALASQKTIENLFGSVSIAADRAFRVGDWVSVDGIAGSIEQIGLRSTAIRTLQRSVIRIPNGRLAEMRIENFGLRDRFALEATLGLTYETTMPQLQRVLAGLEAAIRAHPHHWPEVVTVRFVRYGESGLEIMVQAWLLADDIMQFRAWQQELLVAFHGVVTDAGATFARPTRVLHVHGAAAPSSSPLPPPLAGGSTPAHDAEP